MDNLRFIAVAVSLGGVETIVSYPVMMSHATIPESEKVKLGIDERLIRISIGLEEIEDLIEEFENALK